MSSVASVPRPRIASDSCAFSIGCISPCLPTGPAPVSVAPMLRQRGGPSRYPIRFRCGQPSRTRKGPWLEPERYCVRAGPAVMQFLF